MSAKNVDKKGRWRNVTVSFRCSPEEASEIDKRVNLCGARTKQEYILNAILNAPFEVRGNPLMMVSFRKELKEILSELERISSLSELDEEVFTPIRTMLEILESWV